MRKRHKIVATCHLFLTNQENEVLLLLRNQTGYQDGKYCFIGGHVEENETIVQCLIREAKEEVGIDIDPGDLTFCQVVHRKKEHGDDDDRLEFIFETSSYSGKPSNVELGKCLRIDWFNLGNLPENLIPFIKAFIDNKQQRYLEFGWNVWKELT